MKSLTERIEELYDIPRTKKLDWLILEQLLVDILKDNESTNATIIQNCKDAIDAFTKRGHFA